MAKYCDFINKIYDVLTTEAGAGRSLNTLLGTRVFWQLDQVGNAALPYVTVGMGTLVETEAAMQNTKDGVLQVRVTINARPDALTRPFGYVSGETDNSGILRAFELVMNALETKGGATAATRKTMSGTCEYYTVTSEPPTYAGMNDHWFIVANIEGHVRFTIGNR